MLIPNLDLDGCSEGKKAKNGKKTITIENFKLLF